MRRGLNGGVVRVDTRTGLVVSVSLARPLVKPVPPSKRMDSDCWLEGLYMLQDELESYEAQIDVLVDQSEALDRDGRTTPKSRVPKKKALFEEVLKLEAQCVRLEEEIANWHKVPRKEG